MYKVHIEAARVAIRARDWPAALAASEAAWACFPETPDHDSSDAAAEVEWALRHLAGGETEWPDRAREAYDDLVSDATEAHLALADHMCLLLDDWEEDLDFFGG